MRQRVGFGHLAGAVSRRLFLHPAQITTGRKALSLGRQNHGTQCVIGCQHAGRLCHLVNHHPVERIMLLRAGQCQPCYAVIITVQKNGFEITHTIIWGTLADRITQRHLTAAEIKQLRRNINNHRRIGCPVIRAGDHT